MSSEKFDTTRMDPSTQDFLMTLEQSGVLSDAKLRAIRNGLARAEGSLDPADLAERLVEQGRLTEFQAARLLHGRARGLVLGRYVLVDRIGVGAMGRVFKARHRLMDRVVALKLILPERVATPNAAARFFREMKIVGALDHPNVVRAFDADQHGDSPYIVMEYLEGEDLEKTLRRGHLPTEDVVNYLAQAAWGLAHAHERNIIHRDIKPTNLFLNPETGVVKVLDLGLGAFVGTSRDKAPLLDTDEGFIVGTSDYMSPEQVSAEVVDERTDLFSLGCTMYRLLTRKYAFPGDTRMDRLVRRLDGPHVPITDLRGDLSERLVATLERLLCSKPDDRYASAVEAAEALEALLPASERPSTQGARRSVGSGAKPPRQATRVFGPEAPLDWRLVESALRPGRETVPDALDPEPGGTSPRSKASVSDLDHHRRGLEAEGIESGRDLQRAYRSEVIRLNREVVGHQLHEPVRSKAEILRSWMEQAGESLGDFLAEPSASHMIVVAVITTVIMALGLAMALG